MTLDKNTSPENWQENWIKQADSSEVQQTQSSVEYSNKLKKINDILEAFDFPNEVESEYRKFLLNQGSPFLEEVLNKPKIGRLQFLIQAQINELEAKDDLTNDEKRLRYNLRKQLIALENQKQDIQQVALASEKLETVDILKTDQKIAELRGALLENSAIRNNSKIKEFKILFIELNKMDREDEAWKREILQSIISKLKSPWVLKSIAKELGWIDTKEYLDFKIQLLIAEPDLQESFDRVEMNMVWSLAKIKLWTDKLDGVSLENDILTKIDWNLVIKAGKDGRNLNLVWSNYKLKSQLDSNYERQLKSVHNKAIKALKPINEKSGNLSVILDFLQQAKNNGHDFEEVKNHVKKNYSEIYSTLSLDSKISFEGMEFTIKGEQAELEKSRKEIQLIINARLDKIIDKSTKEAKEKDRVIEEVLGFFNSIGFDWISQSKLNTIISTVNINPQSYGFQQKIDFKNWSLGFNSDFWNKAISALEKKSFIQFFNKMLWENVVDENIAFWITTLQPQSAMRIQALNNFNVGFFLKNIDDKS